MSKHAGSYEFAAGRFIVGEPEPGRELCMDCYGDGLDFHTDEVCGRCFGSGVEC